MWAALIHIQQLCWCIPNNIVPICFDFYFFKMNPETYHCKITIFNNEFLFSLPYSFSEFTYISVSP